MIARLLALSACLLPAAVAAELTPDTVRKPPPFFGSVTFYLENDKFFAGTDENYTQGLRATWLSNDLSQFDDPINFPFATYVAKKIRPLIQREFPGLSALRRGVSIGQNIYTPVDTDAATPSSTDRPYAGWLYLGWSFHILRDGEGTGPARTSVFEVTTGIVGPWALGSQAQNGWHKIIGVAAAEGWSHQLRNEPGLNLVWERKLRYSTDDTHDTRGPARQGFAADFIPHYGLSLGNVFTYANAGAEVRGGLRLPRDFGTPVIRPSADTANERPDRFGVHFFASFDARAIAHTVFLDGNTFRQSPQVRRRPFVTDGQVGVVLNIRRLKFSYSQAARTKEFYGQVRRQVYGSVSVTYSHPLKSRP